jgi:hypothetical protein
MRLFVALTDEHDIAKRAMERETFRLINVCAKLSRREQLDLDRLAARRNMPRGELIRQLILRELAFENGSEPDVMLAEIVGVQLLLMNVLKPLATGQRLTATAFDDTVAEVHKLKKTVARKLVQEK